MEWLNYHHLFYFWTVAKEGSIVRACERLRLAQPTISGQLRALEEALGEKLFARSGRHLVLTDTGQVVFRYAEEIFSVGCELMDVLKGRPRGRPVRLLVGITDIFPKLIAYRILRPALRLAGPVQIVCYENKPENLVAELSSNSLDLVLTDAPVNAAIRVRAFNHLLGSCPLALFAAPALARRFRKGFPASLDRAPFLLPTENSTIRRALDQWFDSNGIRPQVVSEFQDSALMMVFGQEGAGVFAAPQAIEKELRGHYGVFSIATLESVVEHFYAISVERKLKHPAVVAISETARSELFAKSS